MRIEWLGLSSDLNVDLETEHPEIHHLQHWWHSEICLPCLLQSLRKRLSPRQRPEQKQSPNQEADAEAEVGTKGRVGKAPLPLQCAQRPSLLRSRSPRLAPRPPLPGQPLGLLLLWRRLKATAKPHSVPATTEPPAGRPAKVYLDSARPAATHVHVCWNVC